MRKVHKSTPKKRGPRGPHDREAAERQLRVAAERLLKDKGAVGLSFQTLANSVTPKVSRNAPFHYFGSKVGLLAAIAQHAFAELEAKLRDAAKNHSGDPVDLLVQLAMTYGRYAMQNPHLYAAMHATDLWQSATRAQKQAAASAQRRIEHAVDCRNRAFKVFVDAVTNGQRSSLKGGYPGTIARVVTTVVDGYLFQLLDEQVDVSLSAGERAQQLERLLKLAVFGVVKSKPNAAASRPARTGSSTTSPVPRG